MRKSIIIPALVLVMVALTACTAATGQESGAPKGTASAGEEAKNGKAVAKVGKPLPGKQSNGKATVTVLSVTLSKTGKGQYAEKPANGQFAVVDVQIEVTKGTFEVNPFYWRYQTADGKVYDFSAGNAAGAGFEPQLQSGGVPEGSSTRGVVVFDVPAGKGKQVQLTDELGSLTGAWEI
jgi:hypothetical protein